jgi:hypothetical protein
MQVGQGVAPRHGVQQRAGAGSRGEVHTALAAAGGDAAAAAGAASPAAVGGTVGSCSRSSAVGPRPNRGGRGAALQPPEERPAVRVVGGVWRAEEERCQLLVRRTARGPAQPQVPHCAHIHGVGHSLGSSAQEARRRGVRPPRHRRAQVFMQRGGPGCNGGAACAAAAETTTAAATAAAAATTPRAATHSMSTQQKGVKGAGRRRGWRRRPGERRAPLRQKPRHVLPQFGHHIGRAQGAVRQEQEQRRGVVVQQEAHEVIRSLQLSEGAGGACAIQLQRMARERGHPVPEAQRGGTGAVTPKHL